MDYIEVLKADLGKGYSKADLEWLIGLPKNNLSGILKGDRKLSKKSELKIDIWMGSEKPSPLEVSRIKDEMELAKLKLAASANPNSHEVNIQDLNEPTNIVEPKKPMGSQKKNFTINTLPEPRENTMSFFNKYGCMNNEELANLKSKI